MEMINPENMQHVINVLAVIGAILIAVPALLRALEAIFKLVPGEFPDKPLEKIRIISEKIAEVVAKLLPKLPGK